MTESEQRTNKPIRSRPSEPTWLTVLPTLAVIDWPAWLSCRKTIAKLTFATSRAVCRHWTDQHWPPQLAKSLGCLPPPNRLQVGFRHLSSLQAVCRHTTRPCLPPPDRLQVGFRHLSSLQAVCRHTTRPSPSCLQQQRIPRQRCGTSYKWKDWLWLPGLLKREICVEPRHFNCNSKALS